jgi:type II secretory pathway component PulF
LLCDLGEDLPVATRVLIASSSGLVRFWFLVLPIVATAVWMVGAALQRPMTQRRVADTLLGLPGIGAVRLALATARFAGALGGMLRAGMPLLAALDAAREAAGDVAVAERLARSRERVTQGTALTVALEHEGALLASALQLLAVGESSGRLGEMALRASQVAAQEGERGLRTLVTFVEPALIIGFGAMVAFVAAALLQAVYAIRPGGF